MRRPLLIAVAFGVLLWLYNVADPGRAGVSISHGLFFLFVVPAAGLLLWGRWEGLAAALLLLGGFFALSVFMAGKISS